MEFHPERNWPDGLDVAAVAMFLVVVLAGPILGYALLALDIRKYLRALRRALAVVTYHFPGIPNWARHQTPACLVALGLQLPCTADDVRQKYRRLAETLHPDRGGDRRRFSQLHRDFESALRFLEEISDTP